MALKTRHFTVIENRTGFNRNELGEQEAFTYQVTLQKTELVEVQDPPALIVAPPEVARGPGGPGAGAELLMADGLALNASAALTLNAGAGGASLTPEDIEQLVNQALSFGPNRLVGILESPEFSEADKLAVVAGVVHQGDWDAFRALMGFGGVEGEVSVSRAETIALAVGQAHAAGLIDVSAVQAFMSHLGPRGAATFVGLLSTNPALAQPGGLIEAMGEAALAISSDEAWARVAALAFSSSTELMTARYPTRADRDAAFDLIMSGYAPGELDYLTEGLQRSSGLGQINHAVFPETLAALVRLSTGYGAGLTHPQLRELLQTVGPEAARDLAHRLSDADDLAEGGALEELALAAQSLAQSGDPEWQLTADLAFARSPALIEKYISPREVEVLQRLMARLEAAEGEAWQAYRDGYTHRESRILSEALSHLFAADPAAVLETYLPDGSDPEGAAALSHLFELAVFSPHAHPDTQERMIAALEGYWEQTANSLESDAAASGLQLGRLLAIVQAAAANVVERAGEGVAGHDTVLDKVFVRLVAKFAAQTFSGPVAWAVEGVVVELGKELLPSEEEIAAQLRQQFLNDASGLYLAENTVHTVNDVIADRLQALNDALEDDRITPEARAAFETERELLNQFQSNLNDGYQNFLADARVN